MANRKESFKKEIDSLDAAALSERIKSEKQSLKQMVFSHSVTPMDNPMSIRAQRKNIARLMTSLSTK
jgi:large subunit ribosomal protein L29